MIWQSIVKKKGRLNISNKNQEKVELLERRTGYVKNICDKISRHHEKTCSETLKKLYDKSHRSYIYSAEETEIYEDTARRNINIIHSIGVRVHNTYTVVNFCYYCLVNALQS